QPFRSRGGAVLRLPESDREEVVGSVMLKILERNPLDHVLRIDAQKPGKGGVERATRAYVKAMLVNAWRSEQRRCAREKCSVTAAGAPLVLFANDAVAKTIELEVSPSAATKQLRCLIQRAVEHALSHRHPRHRKQLESMWDWFQRYAFGVEALG